MAGLSFEDKLRQLLDGAEYLIIHPDANPREAKRLRFLMLAFADEARRVLPKQEQPWLENFLTVLEQLVRGNTGTLVDREQSTQLLSHVRNLGAELMEARLARWSGPMVPMGLPSSRARGGKLIAPSISPSSFELNVATTASPEVKPPAQPEQRFLAATAPAMAQLGKSFDIGVWVDIKQNGDASAALAPVLIPPEGLPVRLEVRLTGTPLTGLGDMVREVKVPPGQPSAKVSFVLSAAELGTGTVAVRAFSGHAYIGELSLDIQVTPDVVAAPPRSVESSLASRLPASRDATLMIEYEPHPPRYRFTLMGAGEIGANSWHHTLPTEPQGFVVNIVDQLNALARGARGISDEAAENELMGIGAKMWEELLPEGLKAALSRHWAAIDRINILSGDDVVPWELLYRPDGDAPGFLADHWLLYRWRFGDGAQGTIGLGQATYVLPPQAPPAANDEITMLRGIYPSQLVWHTSDELLRALKQQADIGFLHIAAHQRIRYQDATSSSLQMDAAFTQNALGPHMKGVLKRHPLIFLNACSSAAAAQNWVVPTSWAKCFLTAGAGAFVGSLWEVRDDVSPLFAQAFYNSLRQKQSLGHAFAQGRKAIQKEGDPTRLAYTFFGDPYALVCIEEESIGG